MPCLPLPNGVECIVLGENIIFNENLPKMRLDYLLKKFNHFYDNAKDEEAHNICSKPVHISG